MLEDLARDKVKCQIEYARDNAIRDGLIQGIEQGIEQGTRQGIEQGTRQGAENSKLEMIKNMFNIGMSYEVISKVTGKSIDEIEKIHSSIK